MKLLVTWGLLFSLSLVFGFLYGKRIYFSLASKANSLTMADSANKVSSQIYNDLPIDSNDVVFVGTSMTARFPLNELFGTIHIKNRGISSNCAYHIAGRIGSLSAAQPRKIFLEFGINDFLLGTEVDSVLRTYRKVVATIRDRSPHTKIYVQSVCPVSRAEKNVKTERLIEKFNPMLKTWCDSAHVFYIDIFPALYKKDGLDEALTVDGIHLNMKGYAVWKSRIDTLVQ